MKVKGVIFDMDGTLTDSMYIWRSAASNYIRSIGKTPSPDLDERVSHKSVFDTIATFREEYGIEGTDEEISAGVFNSVSRIYSEKVVLKEGVLDLVKELYNKGLLICIATATDREISGPAIERLGLSPYVKKLFTVAEVGKGKDDPDIYFEALRELGCTPSETLVFEDAPYAVKTAKAAGFITIGLYEDVYKDEWEDIKNIADDYAVSMKELLGKFEA
ncbi:MAG: HAD family phosphatase [Ruminococcaceae bacterium]|nr:HAD family phosphatase [Oscillospiraceae bacterium]